MSRAERGFPIFKKRKVIKRPKLTGKPTRKIKKPTTAIETIDRRDRYLNPITQNLVLRPTYLAALRKIKKKNEELQRKFEEVSQKIEKKIIWFPLRKAFKNYTKSFGIKIVNKNDPIIQLNETIKGVAFLLKEQSNIMKGMKYIETLKLTLKKTTIDADKKDMITTFKTAYFNSKAKTLINKGEVNESLHISNQEILNGISVWLSEGSGWSVESVDNHHINIVRYEPLKGSSYIDLPLELKRIEKCDRKQIEKLDYSNVEFPVTISQYNKIEKQNNININVFDYEKRQPFPIYISKEKFENQMNLLSITEGKNRDYILIKDFNKFMYNHTKRKERKHFCMHCL